MKPGDFFIGAMEFLSVLAPGALATFLLSPWSPSVFGGVLPKLNKPLEQWVAFIVCSYVLGHLLHHVGSALDWTYNNIYVRKWKRRHGEEDLLLVTKRLVEADLAKDVVGVAMNFEKRFNYFSWASSWVKARNVVAGAELERSAGESKFFRSLCIVAALAAAIFAWRCQYTAAAASVVLAAFSIWRFWSRRWATSQLAYEYYVMLKLHPTREVALHAPQA